ncbi:BQ5605_C024g09771 [Microbotryum silenes-dioicae]|uniref:BQ5605_C024g09771 protein n=1 Tax=Microbotryum silenes-dioicae TaxID=796604 RepID=A0A2X0PL33_9BASI|nr:BQ5605_C024g09771 [Microbotryum silenes-dioicae]
MLHARNRFVSVTSTNPFVNATIEIIPRFTQFFPAPHRLPHRVPRPVSVPARRPSHADRNGTSQSRNRKSIRLETTYGPIIPTTRIPRRQDETRGAARPPSAHSLKTLPRSFARGQDGSVRGSPLARGRTHEQDDEQDGMGHDDDDNDNDDDDDARFDTYRTAKESNDDGSDLDNSRPSTNRSCTGSARLPVRDVFTAENGHEAESLQKAIKDLEASMKTFKLQPVGPIIADIHG